MVRILLILLLSTSCSLLPRKHEPNKSNSADFNKLIAKYVLYSELTKTTFDKDGWILTDECDALLHNSLLATTEASDYASLLKARSKDGRWFRRPAMDCLSTGSSKSSISRDMLLGLMHPIVLFKDKDTVKRLIEYANDNKWVMGEHDGSLDGRNRVLLTPKFYNLIADVYSYTKDTLDSRPPEDEEDPYELKGVSFTDHLDGLAIEIKGMIYGGINDFELRILKRNKEADPNNALYQALYSKYTDGNQNTAVKILLREDLFPSDSLPVSSDRCSPYLWMHGEKPGDWQGCDEDKTHPGHDFLFVARIILDEVED
jgi:hypothetical protein